MNEENENQPPPVETGSASTEQRRFRPRRRYPRRRFRDRGERFGGDNSNERDAYPASVADPASAETDVATLDRQSAEGTAENGEPIATEPEFGEGIIEISGKGFGFLR
ncbi:MAG TPA: hypothetical protein VIW21_03865, partial [Chthoniobacterales bacterium]